MTLSPEQIEGWLVAREDERLELKAATGEFSFTELVKYCAALANEGGGAIVLGISNTPPREVVGSQAFSDLPRITHDLLQKLHLRIQVDEAAHAGKRVVAFVVPPRPVGVPIEVNGTFWMRAGESLTGMTADMLRRILDELEPDFSAKTCPEAQIEDLDPNSILAFRRAWARKAASKAIEQAPVLQLLEDSELLLDGRLTYAALVLFGTHKALGRHLPQAEVVFEYRTSEATGPAQQRIDFREGFFACHDPIWQAIAARNELQHFREGLFVWDVQTFEEASIRELVLNAVAHRDYRLHGSVFVVQYPRKLRVTSPGGLPPGITVENILHKQSPRNRRICDAFQRCGLVERSGQGMNRIFEGCVRGAHPLPDFAGTDEYQVSLALDGTVSDPRLLGFLQQVGEERLQHFTTEHFLVVDRVHRGEPVPETFRTALESLLAQGIVERASRKRLVLSRRFHAFLGQKGAYTRKVGLDRETNKALLLKHIRENVKEGSRMEELGQVLPSLTRHQIVRLLRALREAGEIRVEGTTRQARWYPTGGSR